MGEVDEVSRDLLQSFMANTNTNPFQNQSEYGEEDEREEEIELNLGLSLGGRFGVDEKKKLLRSSSIAGTIPIIRDDDAVAPMMPAYYPTLTRSSSLPTETEEEWRKRKELQTLRRMEAKRRRSEKQRNFKTEETEHLSIRGGSEGGGGGGGVKAEREQQQQCGGGVVKPANSVVPSWEAAARQALLGRSVIDLVGRGKGRVLGRSGSGAFQSYLPPSAPSPGSAESQGGSSSVMSDLDSRLIQGCGSSGEVRSPASIQLWQERSNQDASGSSGSKAKETLCKLSKIEVESPSKRPETSQNRGKEGGTRAMEDMPCVFTIGDGPNGRRRRIDGILYKYGKGEEVRIMCICCGNFHSPAEFVKHAGGGEVEHPLRRIVVNPFSSSSL
ncbi:Ethylene-responsive binding factor-associated repression [Dillenia turbinata]|uniref:Ninja-family protein n=1 Tax=Dillenia turbinata TaxID=194707 RepID=A0AAN8ZDY4_9MAGN